MKPNWLKLACLDQKFHTSAFFIFVCVVITFMSHSLFFFSSLHIDVCIVNPFMPNGLFNHNSLEQSISNLIGVWFQPFVFKIITYY